MNIGVYIRSNDLFLGAPFNIASYSLLLYMLCDITGYRPGSMYYAIGDAHIYMNHTEQCKLQISRLPHLSPKLVINHRNNIDDFIIDDFKIIDYKYHPKITGDVAV
jgi:thymidylate synthase